METKENKSKGKTWLVVLIVLAAVVILGGAAACVGMAGRYLAKGGQWKIRMGDGQGMMKEGRMAKSGFGRGMVGFGRTSGTISAINGDSLTVKTADGTEVSVVIVEATSIFNQNKIAKSSDLKVNNSVEIIGRPNSNGVVQAEAIIIR